jgi:hypothetical protein
MRDCHELHEAQRMSTNLPVIDLHSDALVLSRVIRGNRAEKNISLKPS